MWYGDQTSRRRRLFAMRPASAAARADVLYAQMGYPETAYLSDLYGRFVRVDIATDRITVTSSGMTGIMMLMQAWSALAIISC